MKEVSHVAVAVTVFAAQGVVEDNFHGHIEFDAGRIGVDTDEITFNRGAVVQVDDGADVGYVDAGKGSVHDRYLLELSDFDFELEYVQGEKMPADVLSRNITTMTEFKDTGRAFSLSLWNTEIPFRNLFIQEYKVLIN